jgi:hypothetical protein
MLRFPTRRPGRAMLAATAVACTGILAGGAIAVAAIGSDDGARTAAKAAGRIGGVSNSVCKMGYDTQTGTLIPPDDSTADNTPAASVQFKKSCAGAVVGMFTSEVSVPATSDFVHIDMRATCVAGACTAGTQVYGSPGHAFFQNGAGAFHVGGLQMVWTGLKAGTWRFEVLPGGNNVANLQFRSFVVTAYAGG